jgi:DNA-binding transcriptional LysR family regulator
MNLRFIAAAHPEHPLHRLNRELTLDDLRRHRHLIVRDTGVQARDAGGRQGSEQRWTMSHKATSIAAAALGLGFAWYAEDTIRGELASGTLKPLPLRDGSERYAQLYLILAEGDAAGPGTRLLAEIIREVTREQCEAADRPPASR